MERPTSDELGAKGEARFREFCADAKLICNKSDRDLTGWDFLVEFPFGSAADEQTLDKRASPISRHVQVKAIWTSSNRITLRLSSAERLAKELKPAFIYALVYNNDLDPVDSYLIHMRGANLGSVLKRLRKSQSEGKVLINDRVITYRPRHAGIRLLPNGNALRSQLERECGTDLNAYVSSKAHELTNLGFEQGRYRLTTTFQATSADELVDAFLGLRPAKAIAAEHTEVRFGIPLSQHHIPSGAEVEMTFQPRSADRCIIRAYGEGDDTPGVFEANVFFPMVKMVGLRIHIRAPFFTIDVRETQIQFSTLPEVTGGARFSMVDWKSFLRLMIALSGPGARIEVTPESNGQRFTLPTSQPLDEVQSSQMRDLLTVCEYAEHILGVAGVRGKEMSWVEIQDSAADIYATHAILTRQVDGVPFALHSTSSQNCASEIKVLYVSFIHFASYTLAFGAVVKMGLVKGVDQLSWCATEVTQPRISEIPNRISAYEEFVSNIKEKREGRRSCGAPVRWRRSSRRRS